MEIDEVEDGKALRAEMAGLIGRTSVPAIWIGKSSYEFVLYVRFFNVHRIVLTSSLSFL